MSGQKIMILVGDGMADYPLDALGGKTPLQAAGTPNMDRLARAGFLGLAGTVPEGMAPGSDTANLSIFGYDPRENYTGRAPLEAANLGIRLGPKDVAFRCNIVFIVNGIMVDFSANHIAQDLAGAVIDAVRKSNSNNDHEFHTGVSYRNIMVWKNYPAAELPETTPPHDIQGKGVDPHLPRGGGPAEELCGVMASSAAAIANSVEVARLKAEGVQGNPTQVWLWGAGRKPAMKSLKELYGLHGYTISAVDLIHGIGRTVGLEPWRVDGVTGYLDTNYEGKAAAALEAMESSNFVFLHVESPDESGHEGNLEHKIRAIEDFDNRVVGPVMEGMKKFDDYTVLLMPDHPTPIVLRTHAADPVPFCIYSSKPVTAPDYRGNAVKGFSEEDARGTGLCINEAYRLIGCIINRNISTRG